MRRGKEKQRKKNTNFTRAAGRSGKFQAGFQFPRSRGLWAWLSMYANPPAFCGRGYQMYANLSL